MAPPISGAPKKSALKVAGAPKSAQKRVTINETVESVYFKKEKDEDEVLKSFRKSLESKTKEPLSRPLRYTTSHNYSAREYDIYFASHYKSKVQNLLLDDKRVTDDNYSEVYSFLKRQTMTFEHFSKKSCKRWMNGYFIYKNYPNLRKLIQSPSLEELYFTKGEELGWNINIHHRKLLNSFVTARIFYSEELIKRYLKIISSSNNNVEVELIKEFENFIIEKIINDKRHKTYHATKSSFFTDFSKNFNQFILPLVQASEISAEQKKLIIRKLKIDYKIYCYLVEPFSELEYTLKLSRTRPKEENIEKGVVYLYSADGKINFITKVDGNVISETLNGLNNQTKLINDILSGNIPYLDLADLDAISKALEAHGIKNWKSNLEEYVQQKVTNLLVELKEDVDESKNAYQNNIDTDTNSLQQKQENFYKEKLKPLVYPILKNFTFFNYAKIGSNNNELFDAASQQINDNVFYQCQRRLSELYNIYSDIDENLSSSASSSDSDSDTEQHKLETTKRLEKKLNEVKDEIQEIVKQAFLDFYAEHDLFEQIIRPTLFSMHLYRDANEKVQEEMEKLVYEKCKEKLAVHKEEAGLDYDYFVLLVTEQVENECVAYLEEFYSTVILPILNGNKDYRGLTDSTTQEMIQFACHDDFILSLKNTHINNPEKLSEKIDEIVLFSQKSEQDLKPILEQLPNYQEATEENKKEIRRYVELQYRTQSGEILRKEFDSKEVTQFVQEAITIQKVSAETKLRFKLYKETAKAKYGDAKNNDIYKKKIKAISIMEKSLEHPSKNLADRVVAFHRTSNLEVSQKIIASHQDKTGKTLLAFLNFITAGLLHWLANGRLQVLKGWQSNSEVVVDTATDKVASVEKFASIAQRIAPVPKTSSNVPVAA